MEIAADRSSEVISKGFSHLYLRLKIAGNCSELISLDAVVILNNSFAGLESFSKPMLTPYRCEKSFTRD